jgi:hypothetical protein
MCHPGAARPPARQQASQPVCWRPSFCAGSEYCDISQLRLLLLLPLLLLLLPLLLPPLLLLLLAASRFGRCGRSRRVRS